MHTFIAKNQTDERGIAALQAVVTLVLVVMSFILGFIVGGQRNSQPQLAEEEPASLEEILKRELAQEQGGDKKAKEFEFYKKLKEESKSQVAVKSSKPLPVANKPKAKLESSEEKVTAPIAANGSPSDKLEASPQISADKLYTLQVGSFRTLESANRLLSDLKGKSVEGFISRAKIEGKGEWYRVRVGRFGGQEEAARAARDLQTQTGKSSLITRLELN